jgi:hypothetical protein
MADPVPKYTIFLLTVWFDGPNNTGNASDPAAWRFRLENPRTKESRGFVGIEALLNGLMGVIQPENYLPDSVVTQEKPRDST